MKFFIKLLVVIVILVCIGLFFIKGHNGNSLLTSKDINYSKFSSFNDLRNKTKQFFSLVTKSQNTNTDSFQAYKWKDKKGVVHYSDKNDPRYKSKLTELKGITIRPVHEEVSSAKSAEPETKFSSKIPGFTSIPLQQIPKLIKNTKQAKKLMEERKDNLDKILDSD